MAALRFTRNQAAQYLTEQGLPTSPEVLRRLAINGDGPAYCKWGKTCLYESQNLMQWAQTRLRQFSGKGGAA